MTSIALHKKTSERTLRAEFAAAQAELQSLHEAQAAITDILDLVNRSRADAQPVLQAIVDHALRLCDGRFADVFLSDGQLVHLVAHNFSAKSHETDPGADLQKNYPQPLQQMSLPAKVILAGKVIQFPDVLSDPNVTDLTRRHAHALGYRSGIMIPMMRDGAAVGVIGVARARPGEFPAHQVRLLQTFANQAAIAIENARLFNELSETLERQTATAEVLGVISRSNFELQPVLDTLVQHAARLCGAENAFVFLLGDGLYRLAAVHAFAQEFVEYQARMGRLAIPPGRGTLVGRTALDAQIVHIPDVLADREYEWPSSQKEAGYRSMLGIPLLRDGAPIGVIALTRRRAEAFTPSQIALVTTFADQAVIAIENARLVTETREALEQQTATAEVLGVINSSPGDLAPVFDAILDKAHALCGAERGTLFLYDEGKMKAAVAHGYPAEVVEHLRAGVEVPPHHAPLFSGNHVHVPDLTKDNNATGRVVSGRGGVRTNLLVPLFRNGALLGMISCNRTEVRPFSDKEIALIENFAQQAVIAIENARLITETREALDQQTATAEVLAVINASPGDLTPVWDAMLEKATRLCDAETAHLLRYDGAHFSRAASLGITPEFDKLLPLNTILPHAISPDSVPHRLVKTRATIHVPDLREDASVRAGAPAETAAVEQHGARTVLFVPLLREGEVAGCFVLHRLVVRPFSDKQIALVENFAAQAVIAMENARLLGELRTRTGDLTESLEYQTAISDVLKVISRSTFDLDAVLATLANSAIRLCQADHAGIYRNEGGEYRWAGGHAPSSDYERTIVMRPGDGTLIGRVALEGRAVQVEDAWTDPLYAAKDDIRLGGVHTLLGVPLLREGLPIGVIGLARKRIEPFTERQIELVRTFADQAVIAMENARLLTETREALDQQTATAEVLQVINSSPGTLAPVFDAMLEKATRLCDAPCAIMWVFNGDHFEPATSYGVPEAFADFLRRGDYDWPSLSLDAIAKGQAYVHNLDLSTTDSYRAGKNRLSKAVVELGGARTGLLVPLQKDGQLLGAIRIFRQQVRPFTDKQIALLQNFAAQAVIAMENARLITETREALDQQTATAEVLQVINSSPGDLAPVFDAMLEKAHSLCGVEMGSLQFYDGESFRAVATRGMSEEHAERLRQRRPASLGRNAGRLIEGGPFVQVMDMVESNPAAAREGIRTVLFVPLRKDGRLLGLIGAGRREVRAFSEKEISLLQNFAAQAVIAIENARLLTETREALDQQTATAEVLQVINASPGDLAPVFDAMLEKAMRLCSVAFGSLQTFDGEEFRAVAARGLPPAFADRLRRGYRPAPGQPVNRLLSGDPFVQTPDLAVHDTPQAAFELGGMRTLLSVPLLREGKVAGIINLARDRVELFSDKEIALVQNFAAQAVIAMENARLITETREALEQQTATAEVLQVINASPGDLAPVFDAMLDKATRLCEAEYGLLGTYDDDRGFRGVATVGFPMGMAEALSRIGHPPSGTALGRLERTKRTVQLADTSLEPAYAEVFPRNPWLRSVRTNLVVPMLKEGELVGAFNIFRKVVRPFTDNQIALLENFAAQAVIAMENARLITETREALERQTATGEILRVISSSPTDVQPTFDAIAASARTLCDAVLGAVFTYDGTLIHLESAVGWTPDELARIGDTFPMPPNRRAVTARAILTRQVTHIEDMATDPEHIYESLVRTGGHTVLSVPMLRDGEPIGAITVQRRQVELFSDKQIDLLKTFADQAVIAIENVRLFNELNDRTGDLQESLEYQTATSDVLKVISRSTFDLQPVLETVVATAAKLCKAEKAIIYRNDDDVLRYAAGYSNEPEYERIERETPIYPGEGSVAGRAALHQRTAQIVDALADPLYAAKEEARIGNARSMLGVPLLREGELVGVIALARGRVEAFADKEIELVTTFADQAVIAIENARLLTETSEARDSAEASLRELKTAQASLIQAEKMASLGQLTAGIAHEIKNPLNFVNNFANLSNELLDELKDIAGPALETLDEDKRAELDETMAMLSGNLDKIAEHGRRADNIVKSMLAHSRGGSGERQVVDLNALLEESLNLAYHGARAQDQSFNITLERDFDQALKPIELVPQDITRVFLNLFGNGFYAANKRAHAANGNGGDGAFRPVLHVATHDNGDAVEIRVRDNGTGIPRAIRDKLFQPFFTTKPTGEGTGLGLSISYDIVTQQHGGTIAVDSEEGAFTEFTIRLPRGGAAASSGVSA